ncbi:MAG: hypothetical protein KF861_05815 [Planctomycetaceae bacterium]|nr:hypothetical protein [Planctomycetaceae bacterium]
MPYLKLFHGRQKPDERLEDWGEPGPIFGPFPCFQTTYGSHIQFDEGRGELTIVGDLVYYDGMFYGDWSVYGGPPSEEDRHRLTEFDPARAEVPEQYRLCACMEPGYFRSGVPGVIAHLDNGRLAPGAKVERCDHCRRYPDDDAARRKLVELGLVWQQDVPLHRYTVHVYATVRLTFGELEAVSHEAAARMADELFDWDRHKGRAEYADEVTEYLVDLAGDLGYAHSRRLNAEFEEVPV